MEQSLDVRIPTMSFRSNGIMFYEVNSNLRNRQLRSEAFVNNARKLAGYNSYSMADILKVVESGGEVLKDERGVEYVKIAGRERYKGYVSDAMKKRMKKCITMLLQSTPWQYKENPVTGKIDSHKLSFITLTTPTHENSYSAKWCHKNLLEPMLRRMRKIYGMKSYIWKCELQENKQVHYHLTCDIMLHHGKLREDWNNLLRQHDMLLEFKKEYGHDNPNSTDIHKVFNVRNLEAYLVKYICKEYQNAEKLDGKIWDASMNIKTADYFTTHLDFPLHNYIKSLQDTLMVTTTYFEKAIYLDFKTSDYYTFFSDNIINQFFKHLKAIQSWSNVLDTTKRTSEKILSTISEGLKQATSKCQPKQLQLMLDYWMSSTDCWRTTLKNSEMCMP